MSERIANLQSAIETMHKCKTRHVTPEPVIELFGHPGAKRCHAWSYIENDEPQYVTVLEIPPVDSAETAVEIAIAAEAKGSKNA